MYAGTQGFWANYVDRNAQSLPQYIRRGLELARDKTLRVSMSQYVRSSGDISFYRHYHGPVYAYWIGLWQMLGVHSEASYRATGLILHALGAIAIFWLFLRTFPELPPASAFIAAAMFATSRTTLDTAMTITQHITYEFLAVLSLFALALFFRTGNQRFWYATAVLLAASFAAVETGAVLIAAVLLTLILLRWQAGWKVLAVLIARGALWFLATLLVIWPMGVLQLNGLKGYAYLAYLALVRKTFSPVGAIEMWGFKLKTYPYEFLLPLLAFAIALIWFRRLRYRAEVAPFLIYAGLFFVVTLKVTVPYTYYHGSLLAATAVVTGMVFGELWRRSHLAVRLAALAAVLASSAMMDVNYYAEAKRESAAPSPTTDLLAYLAKTPPERLYLPFVYLPPLHFYRPDISTVGYDDDWSTARLAGESLAAAPAEVLCADEVCRQLEAAWPAGATAGRELINKTVRTPDPLYALSLKGR